MTTKNIKRLCIMDFDGTLISSPMPEEGKPMWSDYHKKSFPFIGWWGRPESLDLNVFDIKPFPNVLNQLKKEQSTPNTYVVILTSRMEKLRPQVEAVLNKNNIVVDKVDMKRAEGNKGVKVLRYIQQFPDLEEINVYEDRDTDIQAYEAIRPQIPKNLMFSIFLALNGNLTLLKAKDKLTNIVDEEIQNFIN